MEQQDLVSLTADIVAAHVANNHVAVSDLATLIQNVHGALTSLQQPATEPEPERKKALVSVRASVKPDHLVCMECGRKQKTLKRHLATAHGMSPDQYRADYGLPADYPMVAPQYAEQRRALAHAIGLGRKPQARKRKAAAGSGGRGRRAPAARGAGA
jgi:predicted transcriptional regulator